MGRKKVTEEEFFKRCFKWHGDKYNYSKVVYDGMAKKINILCNLHNIEFTQNASDHACGKTGCPECVKEARRAAFQLGFEEFVRRAKNKFGDKYDYSKVNYINKRRKVIIICKEHGNVYVSPEDFLANKFGCPKCGNKMSAINSGGFYNIAKASRREFVGSCTLYAIELTINNFSCIKIGISVNVNRRCRDIKKSGYSTNIIYSDNYNDINDAIIAEYFYHNEFKSYTTNVPVPFDGQYECFSISIKDKIINRLQPNEL